MQLTKDQILEANDLKTEVVDVPEWGGTVRVRTMTGADRDAFEASLMHIQADGQRKPDLSNMRGKLVALTLVDDVGNLMFGMPDIDRLSLKSASALDRVFAVAQRLNGLGVVAEAEAAKNSQPGPSEGSISA